jgi:tetratricopeptide (TPR) repeat protein
VTRLRSHLDPSHLASLGGEEKSRLLHIATCDFCRHLTAHELAAPAAVESPALDPDAEAAIRRLLDELEAGADLGGRLGAIKQERLAAPQLVEELCAHPETWGLAVTEPRYGTAEVVWRLLAVAESEAPADALRFIHLATDIAVHVAAVHPGAPLYRQLIIESRCARALRLLDLGNKVVAERELQRAAEILTPNLEYPRALYCQTMARLRREQQRNEEALALGQRAISLLEDFGTSIELGRAQVELGWTLLQAKEPSEALAVFSAALELVPEVPVTAVTGRLGLALALMETGNRHEVGPLLAAADRAIAELGEPLTRLRLRWLAAHLVLRAGRRWSAIRRLLRILRAFLHVYEDHAAAQVLLDLLILCREHEWPKLLARPELQRAFSVLAMSPDLHRRARQVIAYLAYALQPPKPLAAEVLLNASHYLEESRHLPFLPFVPIHSEPMIFLDWDELPPALRRTICLEVGADEAAADLPANALTMDLRDLISWRYEILQRARILFAGRTAPRAF